MVGILRNQVERTHFGSVCRPTELNVVTERMNAASKGLARQWCAAFASSVSVVILGLALGWPSPVLLRMKLTGEPMSLSSEEVSWMVSLLYIGNLASPMPSGYFMDRYGRKKSLLVLSVVPLTSWIVIFFATEPYHLHVARFLAGCWSGTVSTVAPLYLAEIAQAKVRGAMSTLVQLMTNLGVLIAYLLGPVVSYEALAAIFGVLPIIFFIFLWFMPESPYWLLATGSHREAGASLAWLRGQENPQLVSDELEQLDLAVRDAKKSRKSMKDLFSSYANRKALLIVVVLSLLQRMSGISALMAYTSTTLPSQKIGFLEINDCVIVMGVVWFVSVFIALALVDRLGRKPLLLVSSIGCGVSMFLAGLWFFLDSDTEVPVSTYHWVPFASFLLYGVCFCIGLGPIASTVQGEVFPANARGIASGITSLVLAATSFVMNKVYHLLARTIGMYINYWIFSISCFVATIFVLAIFVETKGKSLYEIQGAFGRKSTSDGAEEEELSSPLKLKKTIL